LSSLGGSVKVYQGTLRVNVTDILPSTSAPFLLGATTAAGSGTISIDTAGVTVNNPITVQAGSSGTLSIVYNSTSGGSRAMLSWYAPMESVPSVCVMPAELGLLLAKWTCTIRAVCPCNRRVYAAISPA